MRKVKLTKTALRNLESEMAYIAQDRPDAAVRMANRIKEAVAKLVGSHPWVARVA